ncbi:MAG: nitrogen fixation protein NifX [Zoogloeaceae bacterium]|jgi:nitrogen fixation protein NifX|nr:nitrogen fixation protein NifX [Zoogloeaceae bacterium]
MLHIAFASTDLEHVNTHFGAAERFVIYDVSPGHAELVKVGEFQAAIMKGEYRDRKLPPGTILTPGPEMAAKPGELDKPPEDKVVAKLEFLQGCAAIYAASIGASSIKRLMSVGIQPIICDNGQIIRDLLDEVSLALSCGGLAWVDRARDRLQEKSPERFAEMEQEGWQGGAETPVPITPVAPERARLRLITSIED